METMLRRACSQGEIRPLDLHIGLFLEQQAGQAQNPDLLLAATLVSAAVGNGHVCLPLQHAASAGPQLDARLIADPATWREKLLATPVVGTPGEIKPLILDADNRLYLYRYFHYEERIASTLFRLTNEEMPVDCARAASLLDLLFDDRGGDNINLQKTAAAMALLKRLLVISGGPGTGKTHTVARILALVLAMEENTPLRIALAAPTGKAAARLEEAVRRAKTALPAKLSRDIPEQAQTLHRLLGFVPGAGGFRHNRQNPLQLDLLVLDEASMIDVVLMDALLQALLPTIRLILLGDHHQLASVEAGSLFGDLCDAGQRTWSKQLASRLRELTGQAPQQAAKPSPAMADSVVTLRTSYRFSENSGIGSLAAAVNNGSMQQAAPLLETAFPDLQCSPVGGSRRRTWLTEQIFTAYREMVAAASVEEAFAAMEGFRILCALRRGPDGVDAVNTLAEQVLAREGIIPADTDWYRGRPLIISRNQYEMQLFNGDSGIVWPDNEGRLQAWFMRPDNRLQPYAPARLPGHETAFAITIHKAQGSEFNKVLLLLPEEESRVLSRELLYTGITRARRELILCAGYDILETAISRKTRRWSGLADRLWGRDHTSGPEEQPLK